MTRRSATPATRRLRMVAMLVSTALLGSLVVSVPAVAATGNHKPPPTQRTKPVTGKVMHGEGPGPAARRAVTRSTPKAVWPTPGSQILKVQTGAASPASDVPFRVQSSTTTRTSRAAETITGQVQVETLGHAAAKRAGVDGLLLRVRDAASGGSAAPRVKLQIGYEAFATAYGGDWSSRLRLVQMPACAATTPTVPSCRVTRVLPTRNDPQTKTVTADVVLPAGITGTSRRSSSPAQVLALAAGPSGGAGSYAATSLSPSSVWQISNQTGDFTWSYPLRTPPAISGPSPQLGISYSSGSVDGRTASTNNQPSWVGEGHSLEAGYVERKYATCADDMSGGNNTVKTYDLCWKTDNATVVLGGRASELIKVSDTEWRLANDDASKMERIRGGATNADNDNEHWRLTTTDGTEYNFGLGKRYAADTVDTKSTWTVPVFGNHTGEPCRAATYAASQCLQGWRWNLDYVVDPHGNTMTYFYTPETNKYGRNLNTAISTYDRGGNLARVEYGERKGSEATTTAPAQVVFGTAERCFTGGTVTCTPAQLTAANASHWPDVPFDRICTSTTTCPDRVSPSFFTRLRLATINTQVWGGAAYRDVDSWTLAHSYPDPGDATSKALWLDSITHAGKVSASLTLPKLTFSHIQLANRVDGLDIAPPLNRMRIAAVTSETGSRVSVNYLPAECVSGSNVPAAPETNTKRCFPVYWAAEGQATPTLNYFHKYPVASVVEDDLTSDSLDMVTSYSYLDNPAWHHDDNELTPAKYRTYGDFRGYTKVRVKAGLTGAQTQTDYLYMRGMDEDPLPGAGKRQADVVTAEGVSLEDHQRLRGYLRETITYNGSGGALVAATVNTPWLGGPTATDGNDEAWLLGTAKTETRTALAAGGLRRTEVRSTFDSYGMTTSVDDRGDTATTSDDLCTRNTYARNTTSWLLDPLSRTETVSVNCTATPTRPGDVVSDVRTYFDGSTTFGATPSKGDITKTEALADWVAGAAVYQQRSRIGYDVHGRTVDSWDALDHNTHTTFTPATGGPVTAMAVRNPLSQTNTTTLEPAWGLPVAEVDANARRTDMTYDPLGRLTAVWMPGRDKAAGATAHLKFGYSISLTAPAVVTTQELRNDGTYTTSYAIFDGLLRPRQTQAPAPGPAGGRILTDTIYNERGEVLDNNGPYYATGAASGTPISVTDAQLPGQTRTTYDGAGRATVEAFRSFGAEKWRTTTTYGGDRVSIVPPAGAAPTTTLVDGRGRTTALRQYHGTTASGVFDETSYTYTPDGKPATVTGPGGALWSHSYDLLGREISSVDPDRGTSSTGYDVADRAVQTADARGQNLTIAYDDLDRRTSLRSGTVAAPGALLASWAFDTLAKGKATSSTRYRNGTAAYTTSVTGYDPAYRPTGSTVAITGEGALDGTYTTNLTYNIDGGVKTLGLPAAPGLFNETLTNSYDALGLPIRVAGSGAYVNGTTYSPFGEPLQYSMGNTLGSNVWQTFEYEDGTRRLLRSTVDREGVSGHDADIAYGYDPAGNVTKISNTPVGQPADTQCSSYDYLRRLTQAWTATDNCVGSPAQSLLGGPAPYWTSFTYDVAGSRVNETQHGTTAGGADIVRTYTPTAPGAHTVDTVSSTGPGGTRLENYDYDATGNTTKRDLAGADQDLSWDPEGHLSSVTDATGTTDYAYDTDGQRLLRRDPQAVTLYLDNTELRLDRATGTVQGTRYYTHNGDTVAVRTGKATADVQFLATDQHGTADIAVASTTGVLTQRRFTPFGAARGAITGFPGQKGFVGGTKDDSTGLTHLGAREYDPNTGRFISVDPVVDYGDPQQHGYAYANNSPTTSADPTGLMTDSMGGGGSGGGSATTGSGGSTNPGEAAQRHDEHANPPTAADQIQSQVNAARASHEATKQRVIAVAKSIVKIVADEVGITAGLDCLTGGDIGACAETAVVVLSSFAGGVAGKLLVKYGAPWKWKAGAALVKRLWKLVGEGVSAIRGWIKSSGELAQAEHAFATAGGSRLRSVNWSDDTGAISWGRGGQKLSPDPAAEGAHSTFRRGPDGRITHYVEWTPNARSPRGYDIAKRYDGVGGSHYDKSTGVSVPTPHVQGPWGVRPAESWEIPS